MRPVIIALGLMTILAAQPEPRAHFDVVSLKINPAGATPVLIPRMLQLRPGGRFNPPTQISLRQLILLAYRSEIMASELSGGPDWWTREAYDVDARADEQAFAHAVTARDRSKLLEQMVQSLLEDRFKLRLKREHVDANVWTLTVAKGGPKLARSKNAACGINDRPGPHCHFINGQITLGYVAESVTLAEIVESLQEGVLRERVVDGTGLSGMFDVNVKWTLDVRQDPNASKPEQQDNDAPEVFTALQEQAGLRLERRKAPATRLILESVEHPAAN
jgi:uncharacterized protein (TIGR03435 family)